MGGTHTFRKPQAQGISFITMQAHLQPSHHILPHVDQVTATRQRFHRERLHLRHNPDVRIQLCLYQRSRCRNRRSLPPPFHHKTCPIPARHFLPRIIYLTVKFIIRLYGSVGHHVPGSIGRNDGLLAIGRCNNQLCQQTRQTKASHSRIAHGHETTVPQHNANGILSALHHGSHIEGIVSYRTVVVGRSWRKHLVTHALPIDIGLIQTQATDMEYSLLHLALDTKFTSQVTGIDTSATFFHIGSETASYPCGLPFRRIHDTREPRRGLADCRSYRRNNLNLPVITGVAPEGFSLIRNIQTCVGGHTS